MGSDTMAFRRDAGMQVGERLGVGQPGRFRNEAFNQREDSVSAVDEPFDDLVPIDSFSFRSSLIKPRLGTGALLGGRQVQEAETDRAETDAVDWTACRHALHLEEQVSAPTR
jgi:hypothetical protein